VNEPHIESVYLTGEIPADSGARRRVLVLGGDGVGLNIARRLIREGVNVTVLGPDVDVVPDERLSVMQETLLDEVRGFSGGFEVFLRTLDGRFCQRFGYIINAAPARVIPKFKEYCLGPSQGVVSLAELEVRLRSGEPVAARKSSYLHAAFLCGLEGGSDPSVFRRVLDATEKLKQADHVQCYVFTRNLKVAASGLERQYRECRENGTLFFKFDDAGPVFETTPPGTIVTFKDPLLGVELELQPDILVVDEHVLPPEVLKPLEAAIPSSPAFSPFLQPESTRFCGVETPKSGILAVGPSRGVFCPELIEADVEAAVLAVMHSLRPSVDLPGPATVDPDKCTMCLTCVRLCPHGAMGSHKHAEADPDSCVRCGMCAAECPMAAIRLEPQPGAKDISSTISDGLAHCGNLPNIIAFLCSRSAALAWDTAWPTVPDRVTPIVVPCAGTISVEHILSAFRQGAGGVLAAGCFKGNCASLYGTSLAQQRTEHTATILNEAGIDPGRVLFAPVAANTPWALKQAVQVLEKTLHV
jgi:quinone-modifying oxidoreductase, subunit QmoB